MRCPDCGGSNLSWRVDIALTFPAHLGCDRCSETVKVLSASELEDLLNGKEDDAG